MTGQKLPISTTDFKVLREEENYYIDKTDFVRELLEASAKVMLIPRPRRFGKTLNLSMARHFFENSDEKELVKELFQGLAISKTAAFNEHFGNYPVIWLTFKDIKAPDFELTLRKTFTLLRKEFDRHSKSLEPIFDTLDDDDQRQYRRLKNDEASRDDYENALKLLSKLLFKAHGRKTIILIDEYDTPIQNAFLEGYYDEMIKFFKPLLGAALKGNDAYLEKAVLTGILRVSSESIFSDLNNLEVNTLLDNVFSTQFGFTIDEVKRILKDYRLTQRFDEVLQWYNGYKIGETVILNPWSIVNYINSKAFDVYWANTSSNDIIKHLIKNSVGFRAGLEILLKGEEIEQTINPNIVFDDLKPVFEFEDEMLYSFLFFSGYLKYSEKRFDEGNHICKLSIANTECLYIFKRVIAGWVKDGFQSLKLKKLLESLTKGDLRTFEKIFSEFVRDTLSYFDTGKNVESVYHAFLLGLLVNLSEYEIISNREAGYGRVDIIALHQTDKTRPALVMELKTIDEFEEETKEKALESAVRQIEKKEYKAGALSKGYQNIIQFGVVFDGKRVWIKTLD